MSFSDDFDTLSLGDDFIVDRWTDDTRDERGHLIWHDGAPDRDQWGDVRLICVNYDPDGEGDFRNLAVNPDRPLDPPGAEESREGPDIPPYDIEDLASDWAILSP